MSHRQNGSSAGQPKKKNNADSRKSNDYNAFQRFMQNLMKKRKKPAAQGKGETGREAAIGSAAYELEIQRKKAERKKRLRNRRILLIVLLIFVVCAIWGGKMAYDLNIGDTFYKGVYVDDLQLHDMTKQEAIELLERQNDSRIRDAEITLTFDDKSWTILPTDFSVTLNIAEQVEAAWNIGREGSIFHRQSEVNALQDNPQRLRSELSYDEAQLTAKLEEIKNQVDLKPVDATVSFNPDSRSRRFTYEEERNGREMNLDYVRTQILSNLANGFGGTIEIVPDVVLPAITQAALEENTVEVARAHTKLDDSTSDRVHNVQQALAHFNGRVIAPGETVSFNDTVGDWTESSAGYKTAVEAVGGELTGYIGGGISQAATTLYNALIKADLEILERHENTLRVDYVNAGRDALVVYGSKDLRFKNNKDYPVYLAIGVDSEDCIIRVYGKALPDGQYIDIVVENLGETALPEPRVERDLDGKYAKYTDEEKSVIKGYGSLRVQSYRVFYDADKNEVKRVEEAASSYAAIQGVVYVGVTPRESTPTESAEPGNDEDGGGDNASGDE